MREWKSFSSVTSVAAPVFYGVSLIYYFADFSGSLAEAEKFGLGPTILGLGAIGLLLSLPLLLRVIRTLARLRRWDGADPAADEPFDADAAIARYKARQDPATSAPPARQPPDHKRDRPTFGRR